MRRIARAFFAEATKGKLANMGSFEPDEEDAEAREDDEIEQREEDALAVEENLEPVCDACRECQSKRENISAGVQRLEDIPELLTLAEVENYSGLTRQTTGKHIGALDDILAFYDLPDLEVRCSLKGAHRHGRGVVVKTLCELVLRMGEDCGSDSIVGFSEIRTRVRRRRKFRDQKLSLVGWVEAYAARIAPIKSQLRIRQGWRDTLKVQLPVLYAELKRRHAEGPRGEEVTVKVAGGSSLVPQEQQGKVSADIRRIVGLRLLDAHPPMFDPLERALNRYRDLEKTSPAVDVRSTQALADLASSASKAATKAETWVRETRPFATEENLWLALRALGRESAAVIVESQGLRVRYMPGETGLLVLG